LGHNILGHGVDWRAALTLSRRKGSKDFFAVDLDLLGCCDPQPDLVPPDLQNRNHDVVADHDALVDMPRENQHFSLLPWAMGGA
jgi:hypothetical protein